MKTTMIWHELPELPIPDIEVLAEVEDMYIPYCATKHKVLRYDSFNKIWLIGFYTAFIYPVKRWAYIEEENK